MKKEFISRSGWFAFDIPNDWKIDEEDSVTVFDPENGSGALCFSAYEAPGEIDPKAELLEHLSEQDPNPADVMVQVQRDKTVASFESLSDGDFMKVWFLARQCRLVFATYNCDEDANPEELSIVESIVSSIRITLLLDLM